MPRRVPPRYAGGGRLTREALRALPAGGPDSDSCSADTRRAVRSCSVQHVVPRGGYPDTDVGFLDATDNDDDEYYTAESSSGCGSPVGLPLVEEENPSLEQVPDTRSDLQGLRIEGPVLEETTPR